MLFKIAATAVLTLALIGTASADRDGMRTIQSHHDAQTTAERLVDLVEERGMQVFQRIDHAAGAHALGESMPATELILFGHPRIGTALINCSRSIAMDLPMRSLIWEDDDGVWLAYNDMEYLAKRHELNDCNGMVQQVQEALLGLVGTAAGR